MLLFFDTETCGVKPDSHLVQLAAILTEFDGTLRGSANLIIKPDGYEIPEEASRIHGITTDLALRTGVPLSIAIAIFNNLALNCTGGKIIAHNIGFDIRVIEHCYKVGNWPSRLAGVQTFCTMDASRDMVKIPPTPAMIRCGFTQFKSPKLSEAYEFAFKKPLENAHDALYDVHACKELYFWVKDGEVRQPEPSKERPVGETKVDNHQEPETGPSLFSHLVGTRN